MKIEALTLLEAENSEVPNIGTVTVGWNKKELVEQNIENAIESHFDSDIVQLPSIDWEALEIYQDTEIQINLVDDNNPYQVTILIQRTVIY